MCFLIGSMIGVNVVNMFTYKIGLGSIFLSERKCGKCSYCFSGEHSMSHNKKNRPCQVFFVNLLYLLIGIPQDKIKFLGRSDQWCRRYHMAPQIFRFSAHSVDLTLLHTCPVHV